VSFLIPATILDPAAKKLLAEAQELGSTAVQGIGCSEVAESIPRHDAAKCERVYKGKNNSEIVLGRDRPGTQFSGCGGRGDTQCGMIDLVAGRMSSTMAAGHAAAKIFNNSVNVPMSLGAAGLAAAAETKQINSDTVVDSNFFADAARVYLTQRAINIDDYLGFKCEVGSDSSDLSAAVVKADCTRIVGRESVRIYAGGARGDGFGSFGEPRSDGSDIDFPRIELIVGNQGEDDMHPAVLGYNLISYLTINNEIKDSQLKIIQSLINQVSANTMALSGLTLGATSGLAAKAMVENIENMRSMLNKMVNDAINEFNHLDKALVPGKKSILSRKVYIT